MIYILQYRNSDPIWFKADSDSYAIKFARKEYNPMSLWALEDSDDPWARLRPSGIRHVWHTEEDSLYEGFEEENL